MARHCSSRPQWSHLEYRWTLENFWELRALASIDALEDESLVWSPRFGDSKNGLWRLKLYPYGDSSPAGKGHVSIFLSLDTTAAATSKAYAIFACYVLDAQGNKVQGSGRSFTRQKFLEGSASWGWSRFIHADDQGFSGLLINDTLTIKCDIDVFTGIKDSPGHDLPTPIALRDELVDYLNREGAKSVQLKVGKTKISINETLLCARSLTFRTLLAPSTLPSSGDVASVLPTFSDTPPLTSVITATTTTGSSEQSFTGGPPESVEDGPLINSSVQGLAKPGMLDVSKADPKPLLQTVLYPQFADSREFVTVQTIEQDDDDSSSNDLIGKKSIVLELTHPDVSSDAMAQMVCYMLHDTCPIFSENSPSILSVLEVFIVSTVYNVHSLRNSCIELLITRITSKSDAKLILAIANKFDCEVLVSECHNFFKHLSPELQGAELVSLLLSTSISPPSSSSHSYRTEPRSPRQVPQSMNYQVE